MGTKTKHKIGLIVSTLIMIIAIIVLGPMDAFTHGFFYDEIDCSQIAEDDFKDRVDLENGEYEMIFSPQDPHMVGFEIYLINQSDGNTGKLHMTIMDLDRNEIDSIVVDLNKIKSESWYKVYTNVELKEGEEYLLRFSAVDCAITPHLQSVDSKYLPDETLSGNILLAYAYARPTFTFQNKIILSMFIIAVWMMICAGFLPEGKKKVSRIIAICILLTSILAWNYMYNSMDNQNISFSGFQADSETLVTGVIYAEQEGVYFRGENEKGFGLGRYYDLKGLLSSYTLDYITDDNWLNGYLRAECAIIVNSNIYSKEVAVTGNYIGFDNGETLQIVDVVDNGTNIVIYLNSDEILTSAKYGSLDDVTFYNADLQPLEASRVIAYVSQYGLQGKVFRHLAGYMEDDQAIANLNLLCSIATALVFVLITMLLAMKYNKLMSGCFFVTFWLSPWIVNFARNLYWVEFTWFIPMLVGLFCAWKINNRKCRTASYIAAFIAVFGKCLCGYEYISVVMMGLIAFLLVDFILSISKKDKVQVKLLFRTIVIVGITALLGFMAAICVHAPLKGNGSIIVGIKNIFEQDVLRRTVGGDLNGFSETMLASLNASIWETYCKYFHFGTEVITGMAGNLFPLLCVVPLSIFAYEYKAKRLNVELVSMYIVFFLTSISWFCLAKGHSYIHTHMNYVLWYFGFVQTCLYIIVNKIRETFSNVELKKKGDG